MVIARKALLVAVCWSLGWPGFVPATADVLASLPDSDPAATELAAAVARLRSLCAPLWGGLSNECMAGLDGIYLDRVVTRNWHSEPLTDSPEGAKGPWRPLPVADRIVWRDVFESPLEFRFAVEDAIVDSRCLAMPGDAPHELRDACAADAFARLSVLHRACRRIVQWEASDDVDWATDWELERRQLAEDAHRPDYAQRVAGLDESELHFSWRVAKCRAVPVAAMERISSLRAYYHSDAQDTALLLVAARLGSVWANTQVGADGAELNATAKANLALAYVRRAFVALYQDDSLRMYLSYLLAAREYDRRAGTQLDWGGLEQRFTKAVLDLAQPAAERILRQGWQPMEERASTDTTWPWAIAPPVVDTRLIRRRLDEGGNVRRIYEDGSEGWVDADGSKHMLKPNGSEVITYPGHRPHLRSWVDENGRHRWLDAFGREHWIDADGAEHWIDFRGTEWILLPYEVSSSAPHDSAGEADNAASGEPE